MKLSQFKSQLQNTATFNIQLPDGTLIPPHFHITEIGLTTKHFIDCGNTVRQEQSASFQLWFSSDFSHRLSPNKVLKIIEASKNLITDQELEIEVEYQGHDTIGKYGLAFANGNYILTSKQTACLANDHCGISAEKAKTGTKEHQSQEQCCTPNSSCC